MTARQRVRNYVLLAELDTLVQDVVADKVCTGKHTDSPGIFALCLLFFFFLSLILQVQ